MSKHLSQKQVNDYLDGALNAPDSRTVWEHLQNCPNCRTRLHKEDDLRRDIRHEFSLMQIPELNKMLPGILTEAQESESTSLNHVAMAVVIILIMVTLLPMFEFKELAANPDILNVPIPTNTQTAYERENAHQRVTEEAPAQVTPKPLQAQLDLGYASPVPPPHATAIASEEAVIK